MIKFFQITEGTVTVKIQANTAQFTFVHVQILNLKYAIKQHGSGKKVIHWLIPIHWCNRYMPKEIENVNFQVEKNCVHNQCNIDIPCLSLHHSFPHENANYISIKKVLEFKLKAKTEINNNSNWNNRCHFKDFGEILHYILTLNSQMIHHQTSL